MKLPMKMQKKIAKIVPGCHNWPKRWLPRDKKVTGKDAGLGLGSSTSSCSDRPGGPTGDSFWAINGEGGRGDLDFLRNSSMRKNTQSSVSGECPFLLSRQCWKILFKSILWVLSEQEQPAGLTVPSEGMLCQVLRVDGLKLMILHLGG